MALAAWFFIVAIVNFAMGGLFANQFVFFCAVPNIIFGVILLLFGVGIFLMARWAWIGGLIFSILGLIWSILPLIAIGIILDMAGNAGGSVPGWFTATMVMPFVFFIVLLVLEIMARTHFQKQPQVVYGMPPPGYPPQQPPVTPPPK